MSEFAKYQRKAKLAEMRPYVLGESLDHVSVSDQDKPGHGGMIARNPDNHDDMWYIGKDYYEANFLTPSDSMTFGQAIESLKSGKAVHRAGWNGKGMYIYLDKSLAQYEPVLIMHTADGKEQPGWLASQADMLSEDWFTYQSCWPTAAY